MGLQKTISEDMLNSMRAKLKEETSTLRMLIAAIKNKSIELKKDLSDSEVLDVIQKEVKKLDQEIDSIKKAGRDTYSVENQKLILQSYLPKQLTEIEVHSIVSDQMNEMGIESKKEKGKLMKAISSKYQGQVDMRMVGQVVDYQLNKLQ